MQDDEAPVRRQGFRVPPSRFNAIKLELAVLLLWAVLLLVILEFITPDVTLQLLILGVFAIAAMLWLILRTRRVLKQWRSSSPERR
jgi:hypothetical protein